MAFTEIVNVRRFAFPREKVWGAFEDPQLLARWWGPKGFTNVFHRFEFEPGGWWALTMRSPGGAEYENEWEFIELAKPERLVLVHHRTLHRFRLVITLDEEDGGTKLGWHMVIEAGEKLRAFLAAANEENLDRLQAVLDGTCGPSR